MKIKLTYFKPQSGKYYATGEYDSRHQWLFAVQTEVAEMREEGKLPGLHPNPEGMSHDFVVLIQGDTLPPQLVGIGEHAPIKGLVP